jgi:hypothetical protein
MCQLLYLHRQRPRMALRDIESTYASALRLVPLARSVNALLVPAELSHVCMQT